MDNQKILVGNYWESVMFLHFKNRRIGAIFLELSPKLGIDPLYSFSNWGNETIVDLPWLRIILTPPAALQQEEDNIKDGKPLERQNERQSNPADSHFSGYHETNPESRPRVPDPVRDVSG